LLSLAETMEKQVALRDASSPPWLTPVTAMCIVVAIASAILLFIVPIFKGIYKTLGGHYRARH